MAQWSPGAKITVVTLCLCYSDLIKAVIKKKKKEGNIIPLLQGKEEDNPLVCTNCLGNL